MNSLMSNTASNHTLEHLTGACSSTASTRIKTSVSGDRGDINQSMQEGYIKYGWQTVIVVMVAFALTGCAHVHQQFAAYDGPTKVFKGEGGTKVTNDGIDFWTTGSPSKNYRVLGILTDQRRDQRFAASSF